MRLLYFDDLHVGERFVSEPYPISEEAIIAFAREFDVQPFHLEREAAERSVFQGLAASGWHTAAIAMRLFTLSVPFAGGCVGIAVDELKWPIAVRPNDHLRLETEIVKLRTSASKPTRGIIRIRNVLRNANEEVVMSYVATAMVQRRPAG